jgi:hypothetical protein
MNSKQFTILDPQQNEGITHEYRSPKGWRLILGWDIHNDCEPFIQLWYNFTEKDKDGDQIGQEECAGTYRYDVDPISYHCRELEYNLMNNQCIPYATSVLQLLTMYPFQACDDVSIDEAIRIVTDLYKFR